jgi:hypothetical protein
MNDLLSIGCGEGIGSVAAFPIPASLRNEAYKCCQHLLRNGCAAICLLSRNGEIELVLSGAERQQRFRERLKAAADKGVTADMIVQAQRKVHEATSGPGDPSWADYLLWINKRGNEKHWIGNFPRFNLTDAKEVADIREVYGDDADLIIKVAAVVRAVTTPPKPDKT